MAIVRHQCVGPCPETKKTRDAMKAGRREERRDLLGWETRECCLARVRGCDECEVERHEWTVRAGVACAWMTVYWDGCARHGDDDGADGSLAGDLGYDVPRRTFVLEREHSEVLDTKVLLALCLGMVFHSLWARRDVYDRI